MPSSPTIEEALRNFHIRISMYNHNYHGQYNVYTNWCHAQYELECIPDFCRKGLNFKPRDDYS